MTRRIIFSALFAALALSSTGCCGILRNLVYRIRHCNTCYPTFPGCADGGCAAPVVPVAPMYPAVPVGYAPATPGCATCNASPQVPYYSANVGVPNVPPMPTDYAMQPGSTNMSGNYPIRGYAPAPQGYAPSSAGSVDPATGKLVGLQR